MLYVDTDGTKIMSYCDINFYSEVNKVYTQINAEMVKNYLNRKYGTSKQNKDD